MTAPQLIRPQVPTPMETAYLRILNYWYRHHSEAPTLGNIAALCKPSRSHTAIRTALLALEGKGYVKRNDDGRFEVVT